MPIFWPISTNVRYFSRIYALFGVLFTGLNNVAVCAVCSPSTIKLSLVVIMPQSESHGMVNDLCQICGKDAHGEEGDGFFRGNGQTWQC